MQIEGAAGRYCLQQLVAVAELEAGMISARTKAPITSWQAWRLAASGGEERKSDRQPYPGRRPTIALACASIETRPLASIGTCSRTRDLSCVTSAVAIVVSIGARLGAAIVVDQ